MDLISQIALNELGVSGGLQESLRESKKLVAVMDITGVVEIVLEDFAAVVEHLVLHFGFGFELQVVHYHFEK